MSFYGFLIFFQTTEMTKQQMLKFWKNEKIFEILQKFLHKIATPPKVKKIFFQKFLSKFLHPPEISGRKFFAAEEAS